MHVLIIPWTYPRPGNQVSGVFFREQALALHKRGLRVGVVAPDARSLVEGDLGDLVRNPFRIRVRDDAGMATYRSTFPAIPKAPRARRTIWLSQLARLTEQYVAAEGVPDVVHAHGILWAGVGAARTRFSREVPVVLTAHSSAFVRGLIRQWEEPFVIEALEGADAVLAVGSALREQLGRHAPEVQVEVVPNLVDTDFFSLGERPERAEFTWLAVASLTEKKGIDSLLHAFASAFGASDATRLRIAGDGPEKRTLLDLADQLGVIDRVRFLGRLDRSEIRSEMHRADAFVLPSRFETFGVVLIEAMATGLPVVATRSGGPEDVVYSDVGFLVAPDDPAALGNAMVGMCAQRRRWRLRAPEIRSYVDERYSERAVTDRIISIYERLVGA